jgi:hypothetical protein
MRIIATKQQSAVLFRTSNQVLLNIAQTIARHAKGRVQGALVVHNNFICKVLIVNLIKRYFSK